MLVTTLKSVWGRRGTLAMSLVSIVLAVAFVAGSLIFTGHLRTSFTTLSQGRLPDLTIAARGALDPSRRDVATVSYSDADVAVVRHLVGVAEVAPLVAVDGIDLVRADGTRVGAELTPTSALGWTTFPLSSGSPAFTVLEGHAPVVGEVALDRATFDRAGYRLGDRVPVTVPGADAPVELSLSLVGVADWTAGADGSRFVFLDAGQLEGVAGVRRQMWVRLAEGADAAGVASAIGRALPGSEALSAADAAALAGDAQADAVGFLQPLLIVFAVVALVVASFLIVNTFSILVAQRVRELGLLRALGASAGQVRRQVVGEALVTGVLGSALGVLVGWGLAAAALALTGGAGSLRPSARDVALSLGLGVIVTVLASLVPAHRASRIAPVVALSGQPGRAGRTDSGAKRCCTSHAGTIVLQHHFAPGRGTGVLGRLAVLNARRQPGRTASTALTLTIGLLLVGMLGVLGASMKTTIAERMPAVMVADYLVMSSSPIPQATVEKVERLPQVSAAHAHGMFGASISGVQTAVTVTSPDGWGSALEQTVLEGRIPESAHELAVTQTTLDQHGWHVGDTLEGIVQGEPVTWRIVGAFSYPPSIAAGDFITGPATPAASGLPVDVSMLALTTHGGESPDTMAALRSAITGAPGAAVIDVAEYNRLAGGQVDMLMAGVNALIGMSVLIAALGIANTLGLSVVERSRELGLLRAVGMTRAQVFGLVGREAVLVSVLGGASGLGLGVLAGVGVQRLIADQMVALAIPWDMIGIALALAVLIGVLASLAPAARAARTDVLQALAA